MQGNFLGCEEERMQGNFLGYEEESFPAFPNFNLYFDLLFVNSG